MKFRLKLVIVCLAMISKIFSMGMTQVWIEPVGGVTDTKYYLGQELKLQIRVNTYGEKITGTALYLTLDTRYVRLIPQEDGKPFKRGNFFPTNPDDNDFHGDNVNNPNANGIDGLQLDYFQQTQISTGSGDRPYKQGSGIVAYFDVVIVGIPDNEFNEYTLGYDNDFLNIRETGYFLSGQPGLLHDFNFSIPLVMNIFGSSIDPPLPDTTVVPGEDLEFYLGDHFYARDYDVGSAIWSYEILQNVAGTSVTLDTTNDQDMLYVTSSSYSKGELRLKITLGIEGTTFISSQIWTIFINHPTKFNYPLETIVLNEDVEGSVAISSLVSDADDSPGDLYFRTRGDSNVVAVKEGDLLNFLSKQDWFGETKITLCFTDSMSAEVCEEFDVTVVPVNDAPVIDFSLYELLSGDTLLLHHDETKYLYLDEMVRDVDDENFTWVVGEDSKLDLQLNSGNRLSITLTDNAANYFGNIPLDLTVYDAAIAYDSKILNIMVTPYSPEITGINPIMMHSDSTKYVNLSDYVADKDTPFDDLTFTFQALDTTTMLEDENVFFNFNPATKNMEISSSSGHSATDFVRVKVTDPEGNSTMTQFLLVVVETYSPKILKMPGIVVYQDSTASFDFSSYIIDVNDEPEELSYRVFGNNIFKSVDIGADNVTLEFESYPDVFGSDTLMLEAENKLGLKDSAEVIAYCIPDDNKPIILDISDVNLNWRREYEWIDLDNYVFDAFTPVAELEWNINYTSDMFSLKKHNNNLVTITTNEKTGTGRIFLTVTNTLGNSTQKEVTVNITKDEVPVWSSFNDVYLVRTQATRKMEWILFEKCTDNETASENLVFSAQSESGVLDVSINQSTGEVTTTIKDASKSLTWMKFTARDESQNIVESQSITVYLSDGMPPVWKTIPTIYMKNTEIYEDLRLLDYCQDSDDYDSDLEFSGLASNSNINIEVLADSYVRITPLNGIYGDNFYAIFKAEDTQGNTVSKSVKLIISDDMPPSGFVNSIVNPVLSARVDFVVSTDLKVNTLSAKFKKLPATSISLNFSQHHTNDYGKIWTEDYKFTEEGNYSLIVEMMDGSNNATYDTLTMTIAFPNNNGTQMALGSGRETIVLEFPQTNYHNKMFFISESKVKNSSALTLSKASANPEIFSKKYNIITGIEAGEVLRTLRYQPVQKLDQYHTFYKIVDGKKIELETWRTESGGFVAYTSEDCEIMFGKSLIPAKKEILPENHFICYPNPFNPTVNMKFLLKTEKQITLQIYNLLGQKIYSEMKHFQPGIGQMSWNGQDQSGNFMPSGVYFVMISKNNKPMKIKKVTLFK